MNYRLLFGLFFIWAWAPIYSQRNLSGRVVLEEGVGIQGVLVVNTATNRSVITGEEGHFSIQANAKDEIRFVKASFDRFSMTVKEEDFEGGLSIKLLLKPVEIEEVRLFPLTGRLREDVGKMKSDQRLTQLKKTIGLPGPKETPRETIPTLTNGVIAPLLTFKIDLNAIYKLVNGDARRMKNLYAYEDLQRTVNWILEQNGVSYFQQRGIVPHQARSFLEFAVLSFPDISSLVRKRELNKVNFLLEEALTVYLERQSENSDRTAVSDLK
ncbi:carboxypeptidase-like regulatory domain-containing protein [Bergeyella sp. RCAD1439]|uniref:carboxypeptidase-like regulatory domain-containing protein n=1 Tax=Bergeyella anatis TaxID=3113737 RepID=UPI002E18298F|nr:carboxypeptidase-like regulatory domain-containing protein [Bergeyella sp. RCAD1439]